MRNKDLIVVDEIDAGICVICGKKIYEWEHVEHIIPYINVHKECGKSIKIRRKLKVKRCRE